MRLRGLVNEKVLEVMEENNSRRMPQGEGREEGRNIDKLETMLIKEVNLLVVRTNAFGFCISKRKRASK